MNIDHSKKTLVDALGISEEREEEMMAEIFRLEDIYEKKSQRIEHITKQDKWSDIERSYMLTLLGQTWISQSLKGALGPLAVIAKIMQPGGAEEDEECDCPACRLRRKRQGKHKSAEKKQDSNVLVYYEYDEDEGRSLLKMRRLNDEDLADVTSELHPDEYGIVKGQIIKEF